MHNFVNRRLAVLLLCCVAMTLFSGVVLAADLSNKWRIKVNHEAKSDGTMVFRVSPEGQTAQEVTVDIKDGTNENRVAVAIREAFQAQLPDGYKIERDDGEDVLIKKRGDTPDFGLQLMSNTVKKVDIKLKKE